MSYGPVYNPPIPYLGLINGGISPGRLVRVHGDIPSHSQRFAINLQCGPGVNPRDDMALHLNFRFVERCIVRNHLQGGAWGVEDTQGGMPLMPGQPFQLLILVEANSFKIALNGNHFCEFGHRVPFQRISHITIDGDVSVSMINYEGGDPGYQSPPAYSPAPPQPSMGYNPMGAPPMGAPPMGAPPMGGYGAPSPYPPNPGYTPANASLSYAEAPPMGYPPQSGGPPPFGGATAGYAPGMMGAQQQQIPFLGAIYRGLVQGKMVRIRGNTATDAERFTVSFQCGMDTDPVHIALQMDILLTEGQIALNHMEGKEWGTEVRHENMPFHQGESFEILILVDNKFFMIALNGRYYCKFVHRLTFSCFNYLVIDGDITLSTIEYEMCDTPLMVPRYFYNEIIYPESRAILKTWEQKV